MNNEPIAGFPQDEHATRFWWVRHAPVPEVGHIMYGSLDLDCDCSDAATFAGVAARLPAEALWVTSPLKRTQQTADALIEAGATASQWLQDERIKEMNFGELNGQKITDLHASRTDEYLGFFPLSPFEQAPGGESFTTLSERVADFTQDMHQQHPGQDIVCVAHRGTILAAVHHALQLPLQTSVSLRIDNVSLTRMWLYPDRESMQPQFKLGEVGWLP